MCRKSCNLCFFSSLPLGITASTGDLPAACLTSSAWPRPCIRFDLDGRWLILQLQEQQRHGIYTLHLLNTPHLVSSRLALCLSSFFFSVKPSYPSSYLCYLLNSYVDDFRCVAVVYQCSYISLLDYICDIYAMMVLPTYVSSVVS